MRTFPDVLRRVVLAGLFCALAVLGVMFASQGARSDPASYYLALGDSLSVGYQPAHDGLSGGRSLDGYVDDVATTLRHGQPSLRLIKLGCPRETTETMISGGICNYANYGARSQLAAATTFLATHRGQVGYVTLNIGINDVLRCLRAGASGSGCVTLGLASITDNLNTILAAVRKADGGAPLSVGMTYYDPFLAEWLTVPDGQHLAAASDRVLARVNATEQALYQRFGFRIADVAGAFRTNDFTPTGPDASPASVQTVCTLTYMCEQRDIHPNADGYTAIANAFLAQLQPSASPVRLVPAP